MEKECYLGLDIGTDSVGYAVTDEEYNLMRFKGNDAWGTTIFDQGSLNTEKRSFRTGRRRLDRRQWRVQLVQELFAKAIAEKDEKFFIRLQDSYLFREEAGDRYTLFNDEKYTDVDYYSAENGYPTIHHLIVDLMKNQEEHDVRLVYLACSWLVAHRGHFLSNISKENINDIRDFDKVFDSFESFFSENEYDIPWKDIDREKVKNSLRKKMTVTDKFRALVSDMLNGNKPSKEASDEFPFSLDAIIRLMAGGTCKVKDLFGKEEYEDMGSFSLGMEEEKHIELMGELGEDYEVISALRKIYDWAILSDVVGNYESISEAKIAVYEQHKRDLAFLKYFIKKYCNDEVYNEMFRDTDKKNYVAYTRHSVGNVKRANKEDFSKFVKDIVKKITNIEDSDVERYQDMISRLDFQTFLPKQKDTDNRVIPHQLYLQELSRILKNASTYLPFLNEADEEGRTVENKIKAVFLFRIPYFVGPLNKESKYAWVVRKPGKIYPWNFNEIVDLDRSEEEFIKKLTNRCTYLVDEPVLPKDSLAYHKFMVLNEINNIKINGTPITVELKQQIYNECFLKKKKVTRKYLEKYLVINGIISKDECGKITGIDEEIKSNLAPQIWFSRLIASNVVTEADVERIIERSAYAEEKGRLDAWLKREFPNISDEDRKYVCSLKIKDFGRLSKRFLCDFEGTSKETGLVTTILAEMWDTNNNLMELLSDKYTFVEEISSYQKDFYATNSISLQDRMDDMYLSNAVKRPVYRTLAIVKDVVKAFGVPKKIFVEMTRGGTEEQKGKRTRSRKDQILDLYKQCKEEDVRILSKQLEDMGEYAENRLQGDKLFLYYMQLGKCMYSGQPIDLEKLASKSYDIDHIYPQAYVKDDSIINNKVLVLSELNGKKSDTYPLNETIRHSMKPYWDMLKRNGLLGEEKYKRLVRNTPFTEEEKKGFIQRQIVETSQSTKAVTTLLKEKYPNTEIVFCKARLTSEFRQEFELVKSRTYNDLHHAVDAYLNIVTGNVYNMKFTKQFNVNTNYSIKTKTLFTNEVKTNGRVIWEGKTMLAKVKAIAQKNTAHFTKFAYFKHGGLFDQMPVGANQDLIEIKKGRDTSKYGGYRGSSVMFFIPTKYQIGKKNESIILPVELLHGKRFLTDDEFAKNYAIERINHIIGKKVTNISFPMGMRPWKVNTVLSLDGFRVCITGTSGGAKCLIAQPIIQFVSEYKWNCYIKRLENIVEKVNRNPKYIFNEVYDKISAKQNIELYDLYIDKLNNSIYKKRVAVDAPRNILIEGRSGFALLSEIEQAQALLNIHQIFGRSSSGCDLSLIDGGKRAAATVNFSCKPEMWKKAYKDVRIIDTSVTGLWKNTSTQNLLDIL